MLSPWRLAASSLAFIALAMSTRAASTPVTSLSRSANQILAVTVNGAGIGQNRLQTGTVTSFAGASSSVVLAPFGVLPAVGTAATNNLSDYLLDSGLINPAASPTAITVTFSPPIVNNTGADLVFLEINPGASADAFQARINGITTQVLAAEYGNTGESTSAADVMKTRNAGNTADITVTSLAQLQAALLVVGTSNTNQAVFGVALDLSDSGVAPGESVSSVQFGSAASGNTFEPVFVAGIVPPPEVTTGPVISEFLADNGDGIEDETGDRTDWIELYNGTTNAVDLSGWALTDDPAIPMKWLLPNGTTLQPYEYRVVFASGKNRAAPQFHTNFQLSKVGGYLVLSRPDGTAASAFQYGVQSEDVSYGLKGAALTYGFLAVPTPGSANIGSQAANGPAPRVVFNVESGPVSADVTLAMALPAGAPAGSTIRFTTDLSEPTETSPAYATPLTLTGSATVRARVFAPNHLPGDIGNRHFTRLAPNVAADYRGTGQPFKSTLPVLVLDSFGVNVDGNTSQAAPYRTTLASLFEADGSGFASLGAAPTLIKRGGTHVRGQSSASFPQRQYAWELWRAHQDKDDSVALLGLPAGADWVLHAPWNDKTLIRNALGYGLARDWAGDGAGMRTRHVEVFFNQSGTTVDWADYRGVYVLVEKIERGADRVDVEELPLLGTDLSGGYIFAKDKLPADNPFNTTTPSAWGSQPLDMLEPKTPTGAQLAWLTNWMNGFEAALAGPNFADPATGYGAYIDATSFQDWHLMAELARQTDAFQNSNYFHKKRGKRVRAMPMWDFNLSFANNAETQTGGSAQPGQGPSEGWHWIRIFDDWLAQKGPSHYPWFPKLFEDPEFRRGYWDRYWEKRRGILSTDAMLARIDGLAQQVTSGLSTPVTNGTGTWPNSTPSVESPAGRHYSRWQILGTYVWTTPIGWSERTTYAHEVNLLKSWIAGRLDWLDSQSLATTPSTASPAVASNVARPPALMPFGGNLPAGGTFGFANPNIGGASVLFTIDGPDPRNVGGSANPSAQIASASELSATELIPIGATWETIAPASTPANWTSDSFDDSSWTTIASPRDIAQSGTRYFRRTFTASGVGAFTSVCFDLLADDGVVVWLNGVELRRVGVPFAPTAITHNTAATALIDKAHEGEWISWLAAPGVLRDGSNTLAVEVHQYDYTPEPAIPATADLSFELRVRAFTASAPTPLSFGASGAHVVRARVKSGSEWSPLTTVTYIVSAIPAAATNLSVTELMYHPSGPTPAEIGAGFNDANDFEFIELTNFSSSAVDLTGVTLAGAVSFNFNNAPAAARFLAPGARVIVVENTDAFAMRYPDFSGTIAGVFAGNFRDSGETVMVLDATGAVIRSFTYDDAEPWPVAADGGGASLVLCAPTLDAVQPASWHPSAALGGAPGLADHTELPANPNGDDNGNGLSNYYEYAAGSAILPTLTLEPYTPNGSALANYAIFRFRRNLAASATFTPESSGDLSSWSAAGLIYVATARQPDGTAIVTYRSALPVSQMSSGVFARVRIQ